MPLTPTEAGNIAQAEGNKITFLSLHTADPGTTGASEATGGAPAYARKAVTFTTTGTTATSTQVTFDVPLGNYSHFGAWSAATGGTFFGGNALSASQNFSGQGQIKLTVTIPVTVS